MRENKTLELKDVVQYAVVIFIQDEEGRVWRNKKKLQPLNTAHGEKSVRDRRVDSRERVFEPFPRIHERIHFQHL